MLSMAKNMPVACFLVRGRIHTPVFLLSKPSGITAAAAQIFGCCAAGKTLAHGVCPVTGENFIQFLAENIAQSDHTVAVQTAGDYRAVTENAKLILQTVAVNIAAL